MIKVEELFIYFDQCSTIMKIVIFETLNSNLLTTHLAFEYSTSGSIAKLLLPCLLYYKDYPTDTHLSMVALEH